MLTTARLDAQPDPRPARSLIRRRAVVLFSLGAGLLVLLALGLRTGLPRLYPDAVHVRAALLRLHDATGIRLSPHGPLEMRLVPRPAFVARDVAVATDDGAVSLQVSAVTGFLSLSDLLRGRIVIARLQLADTTGSIDVDRLNVAEPPDARTKGAETGGPVHADDSEPGSVTLNGGLLEVRSSHSALNGFLGDIHMALDGLRGGAGVVSARASWHGESIDVSGRLDSLPRWLGGEAAAGTLHVNSGALTASLSGSWLAGWRGAFQGTVTAFTPSLPGLMRLLGIAPGMFIGVDRAGFTAMAEPGPAGLVFDGAHLTINDNALEGTVGLQRPEGHWTLSGTLATDKLDLDPFAALLPALREGGTWSDAGIPLAPRDLHNVDLRISVGRLQYGALHAEDAAVSMLCRDGRLELSLGEARAYGGLVKARLFAAGDSNDLTVRGGASWSQVDVAGIAGSFDSGDGSWAGMSSGSVTVQGHGASARGIVARMDGKGQLQWHRGRFPSSPAVAAFLGTSPALPGPAAVPVEFDLAKIAMVMTDGMASVSSGSVSGDGVNVVMSGGTSLSDQTYRLLAAPAPAGGTEPGSLARGLRGRWGGHPGLFEAPMPQPASADAVSPLP